MRLIFASYLFSGTGGNQSQKQCFEDLINATWWLSHVTQLPKNVSSFGHKSKPSTEYSFASDGIQSKLKDSWRVAVTPHNHTSSTWKNNSDDIPNTPPPIPPNVTQVPEHSQNPSLIYAAVHILASRSISMTQTHLRQTFLTEYVKVLLELQVHLVINHHIAMHYLKMIKPFGPVHSWCLYDSMEC